MNITIDLTGVMPEAVVEAIAATAIDSVLADVAEAARNHWMGLAANRLQTTRQDYISGIQPVEIEPGRAVIALVGTLPNLIEDGMDPMDMHDTLLGPRVPAVPVGERGKHPRKDGGYYRAIPLRHSTPSSSGLVGRPMGDPYKGKMGDEQSRKLGRRIYAAAKALSPTTTNPYNRQTQYGERLAAGLAPKLRPEHRSDIYAGMVRERKTYEQATQSQYLTFRTISTGSPGWLRPRTEGVHFAQQVADFAKWLAPKAFAAYVENIK